MPEVSRFFGIVIKMYFSDHEPPHFHAEYEEHQAVIDIHRLALIGGHLSPRVLGLVIEWASQHQADLLKLWERAVTHQPLHKIPPLT